jgi:hypothetical protein
MLEMVPDDSGAYKFLLCLFIAETLGSRSCSPWAGSHGSGATGHSQAETPFDFGQRLVFIPMCPSLSENTFLL